MGFTHVHDYVAGKRDWLDSCMPVEGEGGPTIGDVARPAAVCGPDEPVAKAAQRAQRCELPFCLVLNDSNIVLGLLGPDALDADPDARAVDSMSEGPSTYRPSVGVKEALSVMEENDLDHVVVTKLSGTLVGVVDRTSLR